MKAPTGDKLNCKAWPQEADYTIIQNNCSPLFRRVQLKLNAINETIDTRAH